MTEDLIPVYAEKIVVGTILIEGSAMSKAARHLKAEHFGYAACKAVFDACLHLWRRGDAIDMLTVINELQRQDRLNLVGGWGEVTSWTTLVASAANLEDHCRIVRDHYALRILRETGRNLLHEVKPGEDPSELLGAVSDGLSRAAGSGSSDDLNAAEVAMQVVDRHERPAPTYLGLAGVDDMVFILPGNMVTIRAQAGIGKTALVLSAILNLLPRYRVWFVSLEMPATEIVTRALCQIAMVDIDRAMEGKLSEAEQDRLAKCAVQYGDILSRLDIDDSSAMSVDEFSAKAEHKVKSEGVGIIAIDYAQLMDADKNIYPSKVLELEAISKGIRGALKRLNVPGIVIVHVNKEGQDHGTSQFEKDAHVRLSLLREQGASAMDVEVQKNRNGRCGTNRTPCEMRHGIVGRHGPPQWVGEHHAEHVSLPLPGIEAPEQYHADNPF